jgi:soluble lytic murein transglycosylase
LKSLEEEFVRAGLGAKNPPPELRLLLARIYAAHNDSSEALFAALRAVPGYPQMDFSDLPQEVWDFIYPHQFWNLIKPQARVNKLDPYLVLGLVRQESAFSPRALSNANARGLMQILPQTAANSSRRSRVRMAERRLYNPTYNVRTGCAYLAGLLKEFDGHPELAVAAYNAGDFRVKDWETKYTFREPAMFLESIPIPATRIYVELVLRDAEVYRQLMTGSPHFAHCVETRAAPERSAASGK